MKFDKDQRLAKFYLLFLAGLTLAMTIYTVAGFWVLPRIAKSQLEKHLSEALHRRVTIQEVAINPYELAVSIKGFAVWDQNGTDPDENGTARFLAFDELYAVVQGGSLVERAPIVREVRLDGPYVKISRNKDGGFNFSDLLEAPAPESDSPSAHTSGSALKPDANASSELLEKPREEQRIFKFSIHNIRITNGAVDYRDEVKDTQDHLGNLHLDLPLVSSLGETADGGVNLTVKAMINDSPLSVVARGKPFLAHPEWSVEADLQCLNLLDYLAYLPPELQLKVRSGLLDAKAGLTYGPGDNETLFKIAGEATLSDFEAVDRNDAKLLKLPRVKIELASFEPLASQLHLSKILIQSPDLSLWRGRDGVLNLQKLVTADQSEGAADNASKEEAGFEVAIDAIDIAEGRIGIADQAVEPTFRSSLEKLNLRVQGVTSRAGSRAAVKFEALTEDNATIGIEGSLSLDPLAWDGRVNVSGLDLPKYASYYQKEILFQVLEGRLGVAAAVRLDLAQKEVVIGVTDLASSLNALKLKKPDEPDNFLEIPELRVNGVNLNLPERAVTMDELSSQAAKLVLVRDPTGQLNLQQLVPAAPETVPENATEPASSETPVTPWKVLLHKLTMKDYAIRFEDRMTAEPTAFLVDQIALEARDLSLDPEGKPNFTLSCRVNERGVVQVEGDIKSSPLFADLKLNLKDLELPVAQPYFPPNVKVKLTAGKLSAAGNLLVAIPGEGEFNTSYVGNVLLSDFSSVDTLAGEDLLGWKSLEIKGLDTGNNPTRASIKQIDWREFFARIAISADAKINVLQLFGGDTEGPTATAAGAPEKPAQAADNTVAKGGSRPSMEAATPRRKRQGPSSAGKREQPTAISIGQINLHGGTIAFSDVHIKPNVHARMQEVSGTISGLSSKKEALADVNLRGKLHRTSPLEITGKVRPFPDNLFADLSVTFKDIDMTRWDPYARKYVGYTLEKGNLQLELKYLLAKTKLDATNNIVLDRLTLGDKVDSPDATTLPVKFAISLLQDRKGQIELGIPVTGDLADPQFSLGNAILTFFKNLFMKAVTAPFALLGAMLPEGVGEVDRIEMVDAGGKIPEPSVKKLEALATVLRDRPNLELDIQGRVESESGQDLLRQQLFMNKLKARKLKEVMEQGGASAALDQITIAPDEFDKYLKAAHDDEFPKEGLDKLRIFKKTPPDEMKARLLSTIQVTDDDLRSLAYEWAAKVKEYLQESGKIEPRRMFLREPILVTAADQAKVKGNGVDLKLK